MHPAYGPRCRVALAHHTELGALRHQRARRGREADEATADARAATAIHEECGVLGHEHEPFELGRVGEAAHDDRARRAELGREGEVQRLQQ